MKQAPEPGRGAKVKPMNKVTAVRYCYKGIWGTLPELCEAAHKNPNTVRWRMRKGQSIEEAIDGELWQNSKKPRNQSAKPQKTYSCDAWGHDCFNCRLPDCNDDRPCRRNEVRYVPETEGIRTDSNTETYTVLLGTNRR